ncbi:hypothetical protein [Phytobacter diazotrophicus]|uniref:hypothetical protein n=1 Tax=Phytobacter diazotrophicus TaxID=395631 RepID=UPI002FF53836
MRLDCFDVVNHAENALNSSEEAMAVLSMWIDSIPNGDEYHSEACRVSAVMTLLSNAVSELAKAMEVYGEKA